MWVRNAWPVCFLALFVSIPYWSGLTNTAWKTGECGRWRKQRRKERQDGNSQPWSGMWYRSVAQIDSLCLMRSTQPSSLTFYCLQFLYGCMWSPETQKHALSKVHNPCTVFLLSSVSTFQPISPSVFTLLSYFCKNLNAANSAWLLDLSRGRNTTIKKCLHCCVSR